jgi:uncharacterized membrane protein
LLLCQEEKQRDPVLLRANVKIRLGMTCIYHLLNLVKVSIVIPMSSTGALPSLICVAVFLSDVERVTLRIVVAGAMIIGGVLVLTLWK